MFYFRNSIHNLKKIVNLPTSVLQQNTSMKEPKSLGLIFWERLFLNFPHIPEKIFGKSNNQNLAKSKEAQ